MSTPNSSSSPKQKKNIYLIRHAESMCNVLHSQYFQNDKDIINPELSPEGINQATELGKKLSKIKFDLVIVSPLRRTKETCKYAQLDYDNLITCKLCREGKYGICELMENEVTSDMIVKNNNSDVEMKFEKMDDFKHRVGLFKNYVQELYFELFEDNILTSKPIVKVNKLKNEYNIAIFSHSGFIEEFTSYIINNQRQPGSQLKNADYVLYKVSNGF
jgi:broad specificity phosphatase PhoE